MLSGENRHLHQLPSFHEVVLYANSMFSNSSLVTKLKPESYNCARETTYQAQGVVHRKVPRELEDRVCQDALDNFKRANASDQLIMHAKPKELNETLVRFVPKTETKQTDIFSFDDWGNVEISTCDYPAKPPMSSSCQGEDVWTIVIERYQNGRIRILEPRCPKISLNTHFTGINCLKLRISFPLASEI